MVKKGKKEAEAPSKDTFEPLAVEGKTPATAVLLLSSPEEDILVKACEAIHTFADKGDENKVALLGLGALDPLCILIAHNNKLVRRNAFMALGIMATNAEVKNALKKIDVIPLLIDKLSIEDVVVHEFATLCLALLSVDYVCKVKIIESNGLPPLIQLLTSPDPDVKKNSLEIIFNTAQDYQSRQAVHESGGISLILNLVMSDFPVIQHLALKTLQILTTDKEICITFREAQGFEKLMDILNNAEFIDLHVDTLRVVANCLSDSETSQMIHESGGLARLMEFVLITEVPDIRNNAVTCLAKAALNPDNRKHLHQHNVEKVLVDLLAPEGEDVCVKTATCKAVHAMSFHESSRDTLGELGVIPEIVQCLRSKNLNLKEAATEALLGLTFDNHFNSLKVFKAGGQKILVQHLKVVCPKLLSNSAATLTNMAEMEVIRSGILSQGAVTALVEHLTLTDAHILVSILQCLTMLVGDAEARAELHAAKGLQPLVDLLCSYDKEVLHHACLVINVCATDEPSAIEMHRLGALEKLQAINQSQNRKSCYSNLAMITLVNANMSIKYSLTGHLSATDIITDGFYDVGKAHAGERILTLEELAQQPVNQHKPIIVINTSPGETKDNDRPAEDKSWQMMNDTPLQNLVKEAKEYFLSLSDERGQYAALARLVSDAMGGAVKRDNLHEFLWVLHLCELKMELKSNVVPIGFIKRGIYCHRALLFKCLADCIGLSCTLVRGEYSRAWNEVLLLNPSSDESFAMPSRYIVDLMHDPGSLLPVDAPALTSAGLQSLTRYDETTDWQKKLTPEQYVVTREKGTELVRHRVLVVVVLLMSLLGSTAAVGGAVSRPRPQRRPPKKPKVEPIDVTPPNESRGPAVFLSLSLSGKCQCVWKCCQPIGASLNAW